MAAPTLKKRLEKAAERAAAAGVALDLGDFRDPRVLAALVRAGDTKARLHVISIFKAHGGNMTKCSAAIGLTVDLLYDWRRELRSGSPKGFGEQLERLSLGRSAQARSQLEKINARRRSA